MSISYVVDTAESFTAAFLMSSAPREKFGEPGVQDHDATGVLKWSVQVAVSAPAKGKRPAQSDVVAVTVTQPNDPSNDIVPGMPVVLDGLEVGASAPEKRDNGSIRGGRIFHTATGIRSAVPASSFRSSKSSEPAA